MHHLSKAAAMLGLSTHDQIKHDYVLNEKFQAHVNAEGLNFGTQEEYMFRFQLFAEKDIEINHWNNEQESFRLAHNMFSTMTKEEVKKMLGAKKSTEEYVEVPLDVSDLPDFMDWRMRGAVNTVKNQARCGSCWAFGATAVTEAAHQKASGILLRLSEQQVVSCDRICHGCHGGWQEQAFNYLMTQSQTLESNYPYTSGQGDQGDCNTSQASQGTVRVTGWSQVPRNSVQQLKAALSEGVVTVTIQADSNVFQQYRSGILDSEQCGTELNHAVSAVGYGTEGGKEYFIVRNSWGAAWGDQGYIKIAAIDGEGICGIQMRSFSATTN